MVVGIREKEGEEEGAMEKYELVRDIGAGNFGVARLMRDKETKDLVAMKYIERGRKVLGFYLFYLLPLSFFFFLLESNGWMRIAD